MPTEQELAERFGTPLYVYDLAQVRARARAVAACVSYTPFQPLYAIKANPCPMVAREIIAQGFGIDAVSPGEVAMALRLGVPPGLVVYTENNITDNESVQALFQGVTITCNSLDRLERLAKAGAQRCAVRLNPDIGSGLHEKTTTAGAMTKFGIHHRQIDEVAALSRRLGLKVIGCHMHIGSGGLDAGVHARAMAVLLEAAARLPDLEWLDIGGGMGIPYRPGESSFDLSGYGAAVSALMGAFAQRYAQASGRPAPELRIEPGRYLVAQAGTLLTRVTSVKANPDSLAGGATVPGRTYVGCDSGFNHLVRPAMYGAYHRIDNCSRAQDGAGAGPVVDLVGNICESGDVFARDCRLGAVAVGDLIALRDAGAYGFAMASTYNLRPLPAEVVVDGEQVRIARERQGLDSLLDAWRWS